MMITKEFTTVDKSSWPRGEWDQEPDKVQFTASNGMPALIVRGGSGALCGYVGVNSSHPWFEKGHDDVEPYPNVHGGLTFSSKCDPRPEAETHGICHKVEPGEDDNIWWLGFDSAHSGDYCPKYDLIIPAYGGFRETYKNLEYVKNEIENLAVQAMEAASK